MIRLSEEIRVLGVLGVFEVFRVVEVIRVVGEDRCLGWLRRLRWSGGGLG